MLQQNNRINWIISILLISVQTFKHSNILLPIINPLPVDALKSPVFWLPLIKKDKKIHAWPKKLVVSINDVLVCHLKHS